jgi:DNA-binding transcriptional MocR family regulator
MTDLVPINFTRGVPAPESFPTDDLLAASTAVLRNHAGAALQYGPAAGFVPLREWLGAWQGVEPRQVLTANGSLQIVEFLCVHLLRLGDVVLTESPTYDRTITLLRRHGVQVIGIPLESDGPDLVALDAALQQHRPKLFYVIPDFQNPAGATCSFEKRRRIVELAEQHGFLVLEDAPYLSSRREGNRAPRAQSSAAQPGRPFLTPTLSCRRRTAWSAAHFPRCGQ